MNVEFEAHGANAAAITADALSKLTEFAPGAQVSRLAFFARPELHSADRIVSWVADVSAEVEP